MKSKDEIIVQILRTIENNCSQPWRVCGSLSLRIQGMKLPVHDIDITTSQIGLLELKEHLAKEMLREFRNKDKSHVIFSINGREVEVVGDDTMLFFDKIVSVSWHSLALPLLPLEQELQFYQHLGRERKAQLIEEHLIK